MHPEAAAVPATPAVSPLARPYAEVRVLAGYVSIEEVEALHPSASFWPPEVLARIRDLRGAASTLAHRPNAGQATLGTVDEPGALEVLHPFAQHFDAGPILPISFAWVELANLLTARAIAEYPPPDLAAPAEQDVRALAIYSLLGSAQLQVEIAPDRVLSPAPLRLGAPTLQLDEKELVVRYPLERIFAPICVGYEAGRCVLLNQFPRVLRALESGVTQLLCVMYYGVNLDAADFGLRLAGMKGQLLNQIGRERLGGPAPPLVRDFLDPSLATAAPIRQRLYMTHFSPQSFEVEITRPPAAELPLSGTAPAAV